MASAKELKALITLSGRIDPTLQQALMMAANKTKKLSGEMGIVQLAAKTAMTKLKTGVTSAVPALGTLGVSVGKVKTQLAGIVTQNAFVRASFTSLRRVGGVALNGLKGVGKASLGVLKSATKATAIGFTAMAAAATAAMMAIGKTGLSAASDLAEVQNVVDVTFGKDSRSVDRWSKSLVNAYGLGELSAKKYSSTMGAMLKSSGLAGDETLTMSQNLTMLTGDMASFYNLKPDEMFDKIRSGISGETEPLKQLGINMSATNLQAFALSEGITTSYNAMNEAEKTTLRYNYLLHATADAQGDFARTSDSFSNQQKLMKENFVQISAKIMSGVVPALAQGAKAVNSLMTGMDTTAISGFLSRIVELGVGLIPVVTNLLPQMQGVITSILPLLLEMGSTLLPPVIGFIAQMASTLVPLVAQLLPTLQSVLSTILPPLMQIMQTVLPPVVTLIAQLAESLMPIVAQMLPPLQALISAILPPFMQLINIVLPPLTGFLQFLVKVASSGISKIAEVIGKIAGFFGGADKPKSISASPKKFARGGFTRVPAIFGDAGLEAAIPIRRGNPRSIMLLQRTAQLLGVAGRPQQRASGQSPLLEQVGAIFANAPQQGGVTISVTMAPQIYGDPPAEQLMNALKHSASDVATVIEARMNRQRRLSFGTA